MNTTNWTPGIIVAAVGVVAAILILLSTRRKPLTPDEVFLVDQKDRLADHERRIAELFEELRELEQDRHHLPPDAFAAEKQRLELETAKALRARDEFVQKMGEVKPAEQKPAPVGFFAKNPALKGAIWGGGVVAFFVILGIVLTQEQKPREDMPPRDMGPSEAELAAQKAEDDALQKLTDRVKQNPDDVNLMTELAHQLMRRQDFTEANTLTEKALTLDPFLTEARIHRAVLRGLRGDVQPALDELEVIGRTHPDGVEAWLFAGALAMEINDPRRALAAFENYAETAPPKDRPPQLQQGIMMLKQQIAQMDAAKLGPPPQGNDRPPPLTQEQMQAFEEAQKNPEFRAQAQQTIEAAEKDLAGGKFQDALDKYKSVMPVLPESGRAKAGMAYALVGLNRQPMADRVWGVAVQSDPAAVDALGDSLKQLGDESGAKKVWVKLAESAPSYQGIDGLKKKLQ